METSLGNDSPIEIRMSDSKKNITSDFQCFVCGAVFTTDEDRREHLEKEMHGGATFETNKKEVEISKDQMEMSETYRQGYESSPA